MKILYGPPGTGKTRKAARDAVRVLVPDAPENSIRDLHRQFVADGKIIWVTFHPSYSYEDFVEGLRPVVVEGGGITYRARPGPFRKACEQCRKPGPPFTIGQRIESSTHQEYEIVHVGSDSLVLRNSKGKGVGLHTPVSLRLIEHLCTTEYSPGDLSIPGTNHKRKTQIAANLGWDMQTLFGMTGPLRAVWEYVLARGNEAAQEVVLVVDEINRADLARVFGELITLLDSDKRIGAPEERQVYLPYSGDLFGVPAELSIIGTMNTADRSLAVMDVALRRRFQFEEVAPQPELCASPYGGLVLADLLRRWNTRITALVSREHRIGHSYFMRDRLEQLRESRGFEDSENGQLKTVAMSIRENILPLLVEYFHTDWRNIDFVLGRDFSRRTGGLLEEVRFDQLDTRAGDVADLSEATDFKVPDYWNPASASWNQGEFLAALQD